MEALVKPAAIAVAIPVASGVEVAVWVGARVAMIGLLQWQSQQMNTI